MKKFNFLLGLSIFFFFTGKLNAQYRCGMDHYMNELYKSDPQLKKDMDQFVQNIIESAKNKDGFYDDSTVFVIPIVFHVLHEYGAENITDAQIYDQVNILNRDYRLQNADTADVIPQYHHLLKDAKIEFRLARIDPQGNCTNGIEHIYTHLTNNADDYSKLNQWPRSQYLNVWVSKSIGLSGAAGYAFYPSGVEGVDYFRDGVLILNGYIGSIGTSSPYTSRALTHEIGHYLGLAHTWGSTNDPGVACGNDFVEDTPITKGHDNCTNLYDNYCDNAIVPVNNMTFNGVSTSSGVIDTTHIDSLFDLEFDVDPFKAVGLSSNSLLDSAFSFSGWGTGATDGLTDSTLLTGALDPSKYYEVTITPALMYKAQYTGLSFSINRSATGPRSFAVRSNVDGFSTNITATNNAGQDTLVNIVNGNSYFYNRDTTVQQNSSKLQLSATSFATVFFNTPITFRFYAWNAEDNLGTFTIDNVSLIGKDGIIENVQNYMEYSYCSRMFTVDQVIYMRTSLQNITSNRNNLVTDQNHTLTGVDITPVPLCTPVADFASSVKVVCEGQSVTFQDQSWRAAVDNRTWTFENGTPATSTSANQVVTFSGNGWHTVTLTVSNANGSDTKTVSQSIFVTTYADVLGPFVESFDSQSANWWIISNPEDNYNAFSLSAGTGYNGSSCMKLQNYKDLSGVQSYDPDYYYNQRLGENRDAIISPNFEMASTSGVSLSFNYAYASNTADVSKVTEKLIVYVSKDCGNWFPLKTITGTELLTAGTGWADFVPNDINQWKYTTTSIINPAYLGHNVRFKFEVTTSDYSNNFFIDNINIMGTLGIPNNPMNDMNVSIYPNPAVRGTQLNLSYTASGKPMNLELMDMTGRVVYKAINAQTSGEVNQTIDLTSTLAPGVYSFRISDGNYFIDKKVVIQ
jgi:PKD repeat protein